MQDLPLGYYPIFINVPHPFSIALKRFYCSQEVLSKIPKPIEKKGKFRFYIKGELRPEISLLHMKVLTLIKGESIVFL